MVQQTALTDIDRARYEWQVWTPGFGEEGQAKLKGATVLVSRCGGLGSPVAYELAAAGVGHLIIAHGGNVKPSDLNRQLLMTNDWLGRPRSESAERRLRDLNPYIEVEGINSNISEDNVAELVGRADLVVDAAPLFEERFLMNREVVRQGKVMVEAAMYDTDASLTTIVPGLSPCLACLFPEPPPAWKREFPVFGAVSGTIACVAAMEAIKTLAGFGQTLVGQMLVADLRDVEFRKMKVLRRPDCPVCGHLESPAQD
ncbi:MAG: HesA/MoeB/ThiF family protein [Lentisphaerae bacterium]|jgi:molybdopterin-synthase adenylyltransferase|nr:HesA/MoeB/ThiF family protein [Lentisphaerota bacterium]MBT4816272.1 HesA/MoeB/ThiF family protein [Lentisphaerota bacterium]MBT5608817.1 HesA/MoeB/ThiF family protein [Lentisphaerota bacterium]MBT7059977.1 HesA/MoeB/ThiF family protein [Lentisphaerota bacterium]MBT7840303.1 HesA/MoeB/ThiF family protein [Lentisphaerota bacterium]